jgi:hypothetical protein
MYIRCMEHRDKISEHYESILEGSYDCVDRIVLNAYCPMLLQGGGFRYWWRNLKGDDSTLDNNHLMRIAGRFSRRVSSWCKTNNIPFIHFRTGERKHEKAEQLIPCDKEFTGIFAIFVSRAPSLLWEVKRYGKGGIDLRRKKQTSMVNHYYFHIIDKQWGHIMIRMCAHPPFSTQIILNGHEWVARRPALSKEGFEKQSNCFTRYSDGRTLTRHADTLTYKGRLEKVCQNWFYRCLWFALDYPEQQRSQLRFQYSIYQVEYSRNLLFQRGRFLDQTFQGIIDLTRSKLDIPRLKTIFGRKTRPYHQKKRTSRSSAPEVRIETPDYNLTIFKIHFGKLTVKLYDKGERTLRAEVVVHNAKALKCRRSVSNFRQIVDKLKVIIKDFLNNLLYVHVAMIDELDLNTLASPSQKGNNRLAGINISQLRMQDVLQSILALSIQPAGYAAKDLAKRMQQIGWANYQPRQAAYDLRKLRAKGFVNKQGARKYVNTEKGIQTTITLLSLIQNEFPKTFAILKNDESLNSKELSLLEQKHFNIKKEIIELKAIYGIRTAAA